MLAESKRTHLNRALSKLGYCSRTVGDQWIALGRVRVNGNKATDPEQWVELGTDNIEVTGIEAPRNHVYFLLHKPPGYVTTRSDELGRKTVYDLFPKETAWIFPVGRLDKESEGLLFLTDDGEWANLLTDPAFHLEKEYRVKLDGNPLPHQLESFRNGMPLEGRLTLPAKVMAENGGWHRVVITEGRNRQIRKMFHALGYKVKRLIRVRIGSFELGDLQLGKVRVLETDWVNRLRAEASATLGG